MGFEGYCPAASRKIAVMFINGDDDLFTLGLLIGVSVVGFAVGLAVKSGALVWAW